MKIKLLQPSLSVALISLSAVLPAEIVLDGTLGIKGGPLVGPDFLIRDTMGQTVGGNLFHSFESFTINRGESATFAGPDSVTNIISRVTGNNASFINGPLRSEIPNANLYFLNPNGLLFGEHARLDIQGSFHVSTADILYLEDNGRFDANTPSRSLLTVAPPSHFGFLSNNPADVTIQRSLLRVPLEKTLSITGGDLYIQDAALYAPDGHINLVSVASTGEIVPGLSNTAEKLGTITLSHSPEIALNIGDTEVANIDTSGVNGGHIFIQGGKFFSSGGRIFSQVTAGSTQTDVGSITIETQAMTLQDDSAIDTNTFGSGDGGNISITATDHLTLISSGLSVASKPETTGNAGNIQLQVGQLTLQEGGFLVSGTLANGNGGDITITATQGISLFGQNARSGLPSLIASSVGNYFTKSAGDGGHIQINAPRLVLNNRGAIQTSAFGLISGNAGNIGLNTNNLIINELGAITSSTMGSGSGGGINIFSTDIAMNNGVIRSSSLGIGNAGSITLVTETALLNNSVILTSATQAGGGNIDIQVHDRLHLFNRSAISARTEGKQPYHSGGNLTISKPQFVTLDKSQLNASAYAGNGGNIEISAEHFIRTSDNVIDASSALGIDGNIQINSPDENFSDSLVALPKRFSDASRFLKKTCAERAKNQSRFVVTGKIPIETLEGMSPGFYEDVAKKNFSPTKEGKAPSFIKEAGFYSSSPIVTMVYQAEGFQKQGRAHKALNILHEALRLAEMSGNREQIALIKGSLGFAYFFDDQIQAEHYLQDSIALVKDATLNALFLINLGNVLAAQQKYVDAQTAFSESIQLAKQAGASQLLVKAHINSARVALQTQDDVRAADHLKEAKSLIDLRGFQNLEGLQKAKMLIKWGQVAFLLVQGSPETNEAFVQGSPETNDKPSSRFGNKCTSYKDRFYHVYQAVNRALEIAKAAGDQHTMSQALGQLALLYEQERRYQKALQTNQQALEVLKSLNAPYLRYQWQWQRGRLFEVLGKPDTAIFFYQEAINTLETIRQDLTRVYRATARSEFQEVLKPLFTQLVTLLLQQAKSLQPGTAKNTVLKKVLTTMDQLKAAQLQDYFQDDCVKPTTALEQVDPLHTAIIYPIVLPTHLELLVSLPEDNWQQITVPVTTNQLREEIKALYAILVCRQAACQDNHSYREHAKRLYDWLVRPVEPLLSTEIHTLVFVPDGPLYLMPMAVLHDGQHFLVEKYAVVVTPGMTLTAPSASKKLGFSQTQKEKPQLLYSALTESNHPAFSAIENYATAMQDVVEDIFGAITVLDGKNFTTANMLQELNTTPYAMAHIFSHAQFSHQVSDTFIVTFNDKLSMDKLEALISPTQFNNTPLELLVLSACSTATGDERAALGLAGVAYKAGARSAIATLWAVKEDAAYYFFKTFYQALPHQSKAQALQQAQIRLLKNPYFSHPHDWAAFLLIGNWL